MKHVQLSSGHTGDALPRDYFPEAPADEELLYGRVCEALYGQRVIDTFAQYTVSRYVWRPAELMSRRGLRERAAANRSPARIASSNRERRVRPSARRKSGVSRPTAGANGLNAAIHRWTRLSRCRRRPGLPVAGSGVKHRVRTIGDRCGPRGPGGGTLEFDETALGYLHFRREWLDRQAIDRRLLGTTGHDLARASCMMRRGTFSRTGRLDSAQHRRFIHGTPRRPRRHG